MSISVPTPGDIRVLDAGVTSAQAEVMKAEAELTKADAADEILKAEKSLEEKRLKLDAAAAALKKAKEEFNASFPPLPAKEKSTTTNVLLIIAFCVVIVMLGCILAFK